MAETTAVMTPKGVLAKMVMSSIVMHSLRYCFVEDSPKRATRGAKSVARLLEKSSRQLPDMVGAMLGGHSFGLELVGKKVRIVC